MHFFSIFAFSKKHGLTLAIIKQFMEKSQIRINIRRTGKMSYLYLQNKERYHSNVRITITFSEIYFFPVFLNS